MSKDQARVLCVGDVRGQFEQLAKKVSFINSKVISPYYFAEEKKNIECESPVEIMFTCPCTTTLEFTGASNERFFRISIKT